MRSLNFKKAIASSFLILTLGFNSFSKEKPNIIWLMAEDIGTDIECYGIKAVKTPNLNKLAEEGIKFTNCYCTNSICSPSRSAMMTGTHQLKINAHQHRSNRDVPIAKPYKPFTYWLRKAGYTCILGSEHVKGKGRKTDCNFKHKAIGQWDGKENFGLFDKFDVIEPGDAPFFAQIQLVATHRGDWWDEIRSKSKHPVNPDEVELPPFMADHPIIRMDWAKYLDQMEFIDNEIGTIIADLKKKGLYENTIIIFIGDNGRCNIRGKGYLHDPGLHIPLIVNWPNGINPSQVRNEMISTTDITATILDFAEIKIPEYMTGQSFMNNDFERNEVFSTRDLWDEVIEKLRSISTKKYRYIRNDMPEVPWDAHQAYLEFYRPAVHVMRKLKWENKLSEKEIIFFANQKPNEELYDMTADPFELNNLADNQEYESVLKEMREKSVDYDKLFAPTDSTYHPAVPKSVEILDWVRYAHRKEYLEMLNGKEIGFQKYSKLFQTRNKISK